MLIAGMTMSLDGFVADEHGSAGPLYADLATVRDSAPLQAAQEATGAVLMGRRTYEMAGDPDSYADAYEFQVPLFVVTHTPPERTPRQNARLSFTFVTDGVRAAAERAQRAAGSRAVTVVGGPDLVGQLLAARLVDELHVDVVPVLLGAGVRLFRDATRCDLALLGVDRTGSRTGLRYRVRR